MRFAETEAAQRARERYHGLHVPVGQWIVVRVDGRSFTTLTNAYFTKPFDARFGEIMAGTAAALLKEFGGRYAYTQSDEISVLMPQSTTLFGRSVEKLVSLTAATASVAFTQSAGRPGCFDARLWTGDTVADVVDYFVWRRADAQRNALNTYIYWALREQGLTAGQIQVRLAGLGAEAKKEIAAAHGLPFDDLPEWQRSGAGIWFESVERPSYDRRAERNVVGLRRRLRSEFALPGGADYRGLVAHLADQPAAVAA
ncbi:MAG TPA: tRNA(His) guanylyltransferase Thg1 family protein [Actinospica sp.]|jgi:tRNA(His) 5'-end guanylyltransferase|nr:tRNA(His) guanylyltransferase Thg1 family protein [Actinospica sp.]